MGIIFMDGFERNSFNLWTVASNVSCATHTGLYFSGTYYLDNNSTSAYVEKTLGTSYSELYFSLKIKWNSAESAPVGCIQFKDSAGTVTLTVLVNSTSRKIEIRSGTYNGTLLDTGDIVNAVDLVTLIEVYYKPLNSGGECTVKVNGVTDATYTGDTTAGLENVQTFRLGHNGASADGTDYDDVVVSDSGWIGNACIQLLVPTGAGDTTQWDPSTGSNWECVNEASYSDTDYVSTNTAAEVDLYAITDPSGTISSVLAIDAMARMAYEGTPTPTKQKIAIKVNGTEYYGDDISPTISFDYYHKLWALNPDDSAAWEEADIDALQLGVKSVA